MKSTLRQLEASLEHLDGDQDHQDAAILELREATDSLSASPLEEDVHCILAGTVSEMKEAGGSPTQWNDSTPSERVHQLHEKYTEAVDHHPAFALQLGRIADAFATLGL